jgi:hypothetical protein
MLTWEQVDLKEGEIHLRGEATKTRTARTIDLSVSPSLSGDAHQDATQARER